MEAMRESWTDERLDDFRSETARRFDTLERRVDDGFNALRGEMNARFESMQRLIVQVGGATTATLMVGFLGVIATQL